MKQIAFLIILFITSTAGAQNTKGPQFDIADFNSKFETAKWLFIYDYVAWHTSDSVMVQDKTEIAKLGREWFCFQDNTNNWHAVYGKYDNDNFNLVFHFLLDSNYKIRKVYDVPDSLFLNPYARALVTSNKQLKPIRDSFRISFNQFIRQNQDKTFSTYIFPAFQRDNTAVYGGEFIYTIDQTGNQLIKDNSYFQGDFRGFKANKPREIWLNYRETEKPTLGAIFFVWYYKQYFTSINIDCAKSVSTAIKDGKEYTWLHIEKDPSKKEND